MAFDIFKTISPFSCSQAQTYMCLGKKKRAQCSLAQTSFQTSYTSKSIKKQIFRLCYNKGFIVSRNLIVFFFTRALLA